MSTKVNLRPDDILFGKESLYDIVDGFMHPTNANGKGKGVYIKLPDYSFFEIELVKPKADNFKEVSVRLHIYYMQSKIIRVRGKEKSIPVSEINYATEWFGLNILQLDKEQTLNDIKRVVDSHLQTVGNDNYQLNIITKIEETILEKKENKKKE